MPKIGHVKFATNCLRAMKPMSDVTERIGAMRYCPPGPLQRVLTQTRKSSKLPQVRSKLHLAASHRRLTGPVPGVSQYSQYSCYPFLWKNSTYFSESVRVQPISSVSGKANPDAVDGKAWEFVVTLRSTASVNLDSLRHKESKKKAHEAKHQADKKNELFNKVLSSTKAQRNYVNKLKEQFGAQNEVAKNLEHLKENEERKREQCAEVHAKMDQKEDHNVNHNMNDNMNHKVDHRMDNIVDPHVDHKANLRVANKVDDKLDLKVDHKEDHRVANKVHHNMNHKVIEEDRNEGPNVDHKVERRVASKVHHNMNHKEGHKLANKVDSNLDPKVDHQVDLRRANKADLNVEHNVDLKDNKLHLNANLYPEHEVEHNVVVKKQPEIVQKTDDENDMFLRVLASSRAVKSKLSERIQNLQYLMESESRKKELNTDLKVDLMDHKVNPYVDHKIDHRVVNKVDHKLNLKVYDRMANNVSPKVDHKIGFKAHINTESEVNNKVEPEVVQKLVIKNDLFNKVLATSRAERKIGEIIENIFNKNLRCLKQIPESCKKAHRSQDKNNLFNEFLLPSTKWERNAQKTVFKTKNPESLMENESIKKVQMPNHKVVHKKGHKVVQEATDDKNYLFNKVLASTRTKRAKRLNDAQEFLKKSQTPPKNFTLNTCSRHSLRRIYRNKVLKELLRGEDFVTKSPSSQKHCKLKSDHRLSNKKFRDKRFLETLSPISRRTLKSRTSLRFKRSQNFSQSALNLHRLDVNFKRPQFRVRNVTKPETRATNLLNNVSELVESASNNLSKTTNDLNNCPIEKKLSMEVFKLNDLNKIREEDSKTEEYFSECLNAETGNTELMNDPNLHQISHDISRNIIDDDHDLSTMSHLVQGNWCGEVEASSRFNKMAHLCTNYVNGKSRLAGVMKTRAYHLNVDQDSKEVDNSFKDLLNYNCFDNHADRMDRLYNNKFYKIDNTTNAFLSDHHHQSKDKSINLVPEMLNPQPVIEPVKNAKELIVIDQPKIEAIMTEMDAHLFSYAESKLFGVQQRTTSCNNEKFRLEDELMIRAFLKRRRKGEKDGRS